MINTAWVEPAFNIVRFQHLELIVTDLDASREFYEGMLGLVVTEASDDAINLRAYEERLHHSLVLKRGPEPLVGHIAYRVWAAEDLPKLEAHFAALGCTPEWVQGETGQGAAIRVQDPLGFPLEFFHEMDEVERLTQRYDLHSGPSIMRMEHVNLTVPYADIGYEMYRNLGFRCSEYIENESGMLAAAWLYRKPTVHDVALTSGYGPRLHHFAYLPTDSLAILRLCDVLGGANREAAIERGPGRHGVSNAFYVYLRDPDGHRVELFTGDYYTGDPDFRPVRWKASDPRRRSYWGHPVADSWYEEASDVASFDGGSVSVETPGVDERVDALN